MKSVFLFTLMITLLIVPAFPAVAGAADPSLSDAIPGAESVGEKISVIAVMGGEKAPPEVIDAIEAGEPQNIIVLFDDTDIEYEAFLMRREFGITYDSEMILEIKSVRYYALKQDVISLLPAGQFEILRDYSHLPMMFLRIKTLNSLTRLLERLEVKRVYLDEVNRPFLSESLPLINQPPVAAAGKVGTGTTVAVIDTGVNYTLSAFGSCTSPGTPSGCKVVYAQDFATPDGLRDDDGHGTNVSGIVMGVASDTRIAGLDVFELISRCGNCAYTSVIIDAINWSIANQATYNIVAMNLSLGGGGYTSPCTTSPFSTPVANARAAGILAAIASGNDGYTNGISSPACVPDAVSVGAVYDSNIGGMVWSSCTDSSTYADLVTCFSNSASFLTILAPGSVITAAGISRSGTSQAAPHIAGAIAVLRGDNAFPSETVDQTVSRMTSTGVPVTDPKNSLTHPRIDLLAATSGAVTYSISGTVTESGGGSPLSGVTMTLSGAGSGTTTTNALGNYTFSGLSDGSYTVTPGISGYTFTPTSRNVTVSGADVTGQDFVGTLTNGPDLVVSQLTAPSSATAGSSVSVNNSVTNQGNQTAGSSKAGFYLSSDNNPSIGPSDVFLGSRDVPKSGGGWWSRGTIDSVVNASGLTPGETSTDNTGLSIPANTSEGTFYIKAVADYNGQVAETDEDNNVSVSGPVDIQGDGGPPWMRR